MVGWAASMKQKLTLPEAPRLKVRSIIALPLRLVIACKEVVVSCEQAERQVQRQAERQAERQAHAHAQVSEQREDWRLHYHGTVGSWVRVRVRVKRERTGSYCRVVSLI